jgi:Cytochrome P460
MVSRTSKAVVAAGVLGLIAFVVSGNPESGKAVAQSGSRGGTTQYGGTARASSQPSRTFEERFWTWLKDAQYKNWAPMPGKNGDFYPGNSPHGKFVKLYMNRTACSDPKNFPHGSILIKENYGPDKKTLMAVTVMFRTKGYDPKNNDWYWAKYDTDGRVSKMKGMPIAGRVMMCAKCHSGADGKDYVFANDK